MKTQATKQYQFKESKLLNSLVNKLRIALLYNYYTVDEKNYNYICIKTLPKPDTFVTSFSYLLQRDACLIESLVADEQGKFGHTQPIIGVCL